jgi:hypothetical protein
MAGRIAYLGNIVTQGLILDLDAAKKESYPGSGLRWNDLSSTGTNCQLVSASFSTGSGPNTAIFLTTGSMYVAVPSSSVVLANDRFLWNPSGSVGNSSITAEIWFQSTQSVFPNTYLFSKPWNGSGEYNYYVRFNNANSIQMHVRLGAFTQTNATVTLPDGLWKQFVFWINPVSAGYYVNGGQFSGSFVHGVSGSLPSSGNASIPLALMTLYPYPAGANPTFTITGSLANFKFYNKQLSLAEVQQNFNAYRTRYGI